MFYPAQLNVYGGNSLPQISYQYDVETSSWKKHYNIYDHQGTLQQQYKFVNAPSNPPFNIAAEPTLMQAHYPFGETRWEMEDLAEENKSTLNWIGKQKDKENGLGDRRVRKYEYETGRFTSIDPLWNKYYGWTPYQYSMNSPVVLVDFDGMDVYVLEDIEGANGAGHQAILVGEDATTSGEDNVTEKNQEGGWYLYSKNSAEYLVIGSVTDYEDGERYATFNEFLLKDEQKRYDKAIKFETTKEQDNVIKDQASEQVKEWYDVLQNSCNNTAQCGFNEVNRQAGNMVIQPGTSAIPNV